MLSSHTVGFQWPDNSNLANLTPGLCNSSWSWENSLIDSVWSLILVKSNQYTVEGFDFAEINDLLCILVTS